MLIILITMILKKDTVVPCTLGVFCLGLFYKHSLFGAVSAVFTSFIISLNELGPIILIISVMVALSKTLEDNNAMHYMVRLFSKVIKSSSTAFFVVGIVMLLLSWFFWPTLAVALVGAIIPIAAFFYMGEVVPLTGVLGDVLAHNFQKKVYFS